MPQPTTSELPRPKSWEEFEDIVWDVYSRKWHDPNAHRYGRAGQRQHGVDIYGQPSALGGSYAGIQCKRFDAGKLTTAKIRAEISMAEEFEPPLGQYTIATTESRDARLQDTIRKINAVRDAEVRFSVQLVFWEDLCADLTAADNYDLLAKHYGSWGPVFRSILGPLPLMRDLRRESFKLGDNAAANFPFVSAPVQDTFDGVVRTLDEVSGGTSVKLGALVRGEANAGKTRLALEALKQALPEWSVLRWSPASTMADAPAPAVMQGGNLVLVIDDLQDYVPVGLPADRFPLNVTDPRATMLRRVVEYVREHAQQVVVLATCRSEDDLRVRAALGWLLVQLVVVTVPTFSPLRGQPTAAEVIAAFADQDAPYVNDWDGTIGSLILGLSSKESQYLAMAETQAATILRAMKLLMYANVVEHTERRLRAVCADVFGDTALLETARAWRSAVDDLVRLQFVTMDALSSNSALVIRQDSYLAKVVTDYSPDATPHRFAQDIALLKDLFITLRDADALVRLGELYEHSGKVHEHAQHYVESLAILLAALQIDGTNVQAWRAMGSVYFAMERYEEALNAANTAISLDPSNGVHWYNKTACLSQLGRHEEALAAIERAISLNPDDASSWAAKGQLLIEAARYEDALPVLTRVVELNPPDARSWYNRGVLLAKLGRYEEALDSCNHALSIDPNKADGWFSKADDLLSLQRYAEVLDAADRALALEPNMGQALAIRVDALLKLNRYEDAAASAADAVQLVQDNARIWLMLGEASAKLDRYDIALDAYEKAIATDPSGVEAWNGKSKMLGQMGKHREAAETYDRALEHTDDVAMKAMIFYNKAVALGHGQWFNEALEAYDRSVALKPTDAGAWNNKAFAHFRLGQWQQALSSAERALELDPAYAFAWANKGDALVALTRDEEALAAYNQALALQPGLTYVLMHKAALLGAMHRFEEAVELFDSVIVLQPENSDAWKLKGKALMVLGRNTEAVAALEHGISLMPSDSNAWNTLGAVLSLLERTADASAAFDRALEIDPENTLARSNKERLSVSPEEASGSAGQGGNNT